MGSDDDSRRRRLTLDELLEEMRELVAEATPADLDAMKIRYDALHRNACTKAVASGAGKPDEVWIGETKVVPARFAEVLRTRHGMLHRDFEDPTVVPLPPCIGPVIPIVHVLWHSETLCAYMPGSVPGQWPTGHTWTSRDAIHDATCSECIAKLPELPPRREP